MAILLNVIKVFSRVLLPTWYLCRNLTNLWTITSDKGHIEQVLMNLAINARDATPNGVELMIATRNIVVTIMQPNRHLVVPP